MTPDANFAEVIAFDAISAEFTAFAAIWSEPTESVAS
jgi:hypothetical protein